MEALLHFQPQRSGAGAEPSIELPVLERFLHFKLCEGWDPVVSHCQGSLYKSNYFRRNEKLFLPQLFHPVSPGSNSLIPSNWVSQFLWITVVQVGRCYLYQQCWLWLFSWPIKTLFVWRLTMRNSRDYFLDVSSKTDCFVSWWNIFSSSHVILSFIFFSCLFNHIPALSNLMNLFLSIKHQLCSQVYLMILTL